MGRQFYLNFVSFPQAHALQGTAWLFSSKRRHQTAMCPYASRLEIPQRCTESYGQPLSHTAFSCEMEGPSHLAVQTGKVLVVWPVIVWKMSISLDCYINQMMIHFPNKSARVYIASYLTNSINCFPGGAYNKIEKFQAFRTTSSNKPLQEG